LAHVILDLLQHILYWSKSIVGVLNHSGNARVFYLLLIIIGSTGLGLGIHSASAYTTSPDCFAAPGPNVNYNDCNFDAHPPDFSHANLAGATFIHSQISGVNFAFANLVGANFNEADNDNGASTPSTDTDFSHANLDGATFVGANPSEGHLAFQGANLHNVDFSGADLFNCELTSQADITGANFSGASLQDTDFTQSIMKNVIFSGATFFEGTKFNRVDFSGSSLTNLDFSNLLFDGANFSGADLTGSKFINAELLQANLGGGLFLDPSFHNTNLSNVDFTGAKISTNADFTGAITTGTIFACGQPPPSGPNPVCTPTNNPPPVIHYDQISFTGGIAVGQVNATAWKFSAAGPSGVNEQYTGVYATIGTSNRQYPVSCTPPPTGSPTYTYPIGTTQVTCTATDPTVIPPTPSHTTTSHFYIIVVDNVPPTVTATPNPVIAEATGSGGATVNYHVHATDLVNGNIPITGSTVPPVSYCSPGNGTQFVIGSTTVTCNVADPTHPSDVGTLSFPVIVQDTTPPTITANNVIPEATGPGGATVIYSATASDLVDGNIVLTGSGPTNYCTPASGSQFILGPTTVTCYATDSHHNQATKSFTVTVKDTTAPTITAPSDITQVATGTYTPVTLGTPTGVSDLVDPHPTVTNNVSTVAPNGFPVGETDVKWTATDFTGNSKSVIQKITITSNVPITLTAPVDINAQATGPLTQVNLGTATFTDPLDPNPTITNNAPSGGFQVGTTVVAWHLVDKYGNTANSAQTVIIVDTTGPLIIPKSDPQYTEATSSSGAIVSYYVTATDLVDGKVATSCLPLNGTQFAMGPTTVTCTAIDSNHNTSTKSFTETVRDTKGPIITLPTLPIVVEAINQNGAPVTFTVTANDAITGPAPVTCTPPSGTVIFGTQTITCTATDKANPPNTSSASFSVLVHDTTAPSFTTLPLPTITQVATGTYTPVTLVTPTIHDSVDPVPTVTNNVSTVAPNGFPVGTTIVTWTAMDASGNKATTTQTVVILPKNTPGKVNGAGQFGKDIKFNMEVQSKDGLTFKGHLDFDDKNAKIDLDSQTITGLFIDQTVTQADFTGTATLNGHSGYTFKAHVIDNGNPGKNKDFFQITIFDSLGNQVYTKSGTITDGNLHVSNKADVADDEDDHDARDKSKK
jgi:uncharacterized protein YjbI with pentapeptide repeats